MAVRSETLKMPPDQFEQLEWRWGWKYEYMEENAIVSPRDNSVFVRAPITPRLVAVPYGDLDLHIQSIYANDDPIDIKRLVSAFIDTFIETSEFCDYEYAQIEAAAWKRVNGFFTGKYGHPHPASRIAIVPDEHFPVAAAAFVTTRTDGPVLDLLFVRQEWQRRGLATALVTHVMNDLQAEAATSLRSTYHVANEASAGWHKRFGFVEEPDLFLAKLRLHHARHEHYRQQLLGDTGESQRLSIECRALEAEIGRLEQIAGRDGYKAVVPLLRYE